MYTYHMMSKITPWLTLYYEQEFTRDMVWYVKINAIHFMNRLRRKNCVIDLWFFSEWDFAKQADWKGLRQVQSRKFKVHAANIESPNLFRGFL